MNKQLKSEKVEISDEDLKYSFKEQYKFLQEACDRFDPGIRTGNMVEAKNISIYLRKILYDTKSGSSTSLLFHLFNKEKEAMLFVDTVTDKFDPKSILGGSFPLTANYLEGSIQAVGTNGISGINILPKCLHPNKNINGTCSLVAFSKWWEGIVVYSKDENMQLTRNKLVVTIANTDGGAHIDKSLDKSYHRLSREEKLSELDRNIILINGKQSPIDMIYMTIRQIAHEVLLTLKPCYNDL